jgi:CDP-2,3-bis-(O-geranylgeranyl)-sn-glycerol synthase
MEEKDSLSPTEETLEQKMVIPPKHKFWLGPRKLDAGEKRNAKFAFLLASCGVLAFLLQYLYFSAYISISDWLCVIIYWIVFIMPGYLANAGMSIWGGGTPMDFGRNWKDGRRILGPGKTWRGFIMGPLGFGIPLAILVHVIIYLNWPAIINIATKFIIDDPHLYRLYANDPQKLIHDLALFLIGDSNATNPTVPWGSFYLLLPRIILCAYGAPIGDATKSFFKRRRGLDRGEPWWGLDQLDFIFGCLLCSGWFVFFGLNWAILINVLIMLLVISPTITVIANTLNYLSGHKKVPW